MTDQKPTLRKRILVPPHVPAMLDHDERCSWVQSAAKDGCDCEARLPEPEDELAYWAAEQLWLDRP